MIAALGVFGVADHIAHFRGGGSRAILTALPTNAGRQDEL